MEEEVTNNDYKYNEKIHSKTKKSALQQSTQSTLGKVENSLRNNTDYVNEKFESFEQPKIRKLNKVHSNQSNIIHVSFILPLRPNPLPKLVE